MEIRKGATRLVIISKRRAYKLPLLHSWKHFLTGLLANMQERLFSQAGWPELCPVLFSLPGGWLVVMPRVDVCRPHDVLDFETLCDRGDYVLPVEHKNDSFGWLDGRLVAIDYGS